MSVHFDQLIPLSIFFTSLLGSWHCAGMCGAIACSASLKAKSHYYHLGRLISYASLGFISGLLGQSILKTDIPYFDKVSGIIMGAFLLLIGFRIILKRPVSFELSFSKCLMPVIRKMPNEEFAIGILTGFIPCGWLYTFVLAAAATKNPFTGAFCLFLFWLGTVPALTTMSAAMKGLLKNQNNNVRIFSGAILIISGLYSIVAHYMTH